MGFVKCLFLFQFSQVHFEFQLNLNLFQFTRVKQIRQKWQLECVHFQKLEKYRCEGYMWKPPVHMKMPEQDLFGYSSLVLFVFLCGHFSRKGSIVLSICLFAA